MVRLIGLFLSSSENYISEKCNSSNKEYLFGLRKDYNHHTELSHVQGADLTVKLMYSQNLNKLMLKCIFFSVGECQWQCPAQ